MKRQMRKKLFLAQLRTCPWGVTLLSAFSDFLFFPPREVTAVWFLPLDSTTICSSTAKSCWSQWEKDGFCDLACTFCPSANGIHYQKQTLMGALSPGLGITWQLHSQAIWVYTSIYLWIPCAHLPSRTDLDQTDLDQSNHLMGGLCGWQGYQDSTAYVVWICLSKYMFNSNWFFKNWNFITTTKHIIREELGYKM